MLSATTNLIDTRAAATHCGFAYGAFITLRTSGQTPPPDGWQGKRALYSPATLDAWMLARGGKKSWRPFSSCVSQAT